MSTAEAPDPALTIGEDVESGAEIDLPVEDVLTGRGVLFGQSGGGKSNSAGVVIEELLDDGHALLIVDTDGEYYSLKEAYEVLHATGDDEGDIQVGPEHADHLASLAMEQNTPVILDVSAFLDPEDADELVGRVARALFAKAKKLRKPFLLVVEEAHEYVPQQGSGGFAADHITRIAKRGRKHGLGFLGISQRPANVDKDVVTQCNWLVWHRLKYRNDIDVVDGLYGSAIADRMDGLANGEAYVDTDWFDQAIWVQWRRKRTFDLGETPGLGDTETPELRPIDASVLEELREAGGAARSRTERIEQLEDELAEREATIEELERETERLEERNAWEEMMAERAFEGLGGELNLELGETGSIRAEVLEVVEQRDELDEENERLQEDLRAAQTEADRLEAEVETLQDELEQVERDEDLEQLRDDLREIVLDRHPDVLGVEEDQRVDDLRQQLKDARERIDELQSRRPTEVEIEADLLANDVVREHIDDVAARSSYSDENVWDVVVALSSLADGKSARVAEIERQVPLAEKTVLAIANHLAENGVATKSREGRSNAYALDRESLRDRIKLTDQQKAITETRQQIRSRSDSVEVRGEESTEPTDVDSPDRPAVREQLMAGFQEDAVDRLMDRIADLSTRQRRLLTYIESRGRNVESQKAWVQRALGLDSNPNREHYDEMGELIEAGFVEKNKDNSIKPNVRGLVERELDGYDFDEADVDETYEGVLERLAGGERTQPIRSE